jgi:hypothetical protein
MGVDIKKLIAAINPEIYCDNTPDEKGVPLGRAVEKIVRAKGYLAGAEIAKLKRSDYIDIFDTRFQKGAFSLEGIKSPVEQHKLVYDVFSQSLEPIYFWILDYVNEEFSSSEKLVDNFVSSVGSSHFSEMGGKQTRMQDEAMKIFGNVNTVIRSVLNIIYDLKEFKIRLGHYDALKSKNTGVKNAANLSLKQIWLDNVDIKRGNSAIKAMSQQFDYVTIIDAFMSSRTLEDVSKLDLNDRVKRILEQRISEYIAWIDASEKELRKRFEIERVYLKSQVSSLKLYSRWLKPYLKSARDLEQRMEPDAALVNSFNTNLMELVLLAKGKYDPIGDIQRGELPSVFKKLKLRSYSPLTIIEIKFRSVPERATQQGGYGFRGRVEITFTSFALNSDELSILKEEIEKDDFGDMYDAITGATDRSLDEIRWDIEELTGESVNEVKKEESEDVNPIGSLFSFLRKSKKSDSKGGIVKDNEYEKVIRSQAILGSRWSCRKMYNDFKKSNEMPAFPPVQY